MDNNTRAIYEWVNSNLELYLIINFVVLMILILILSSIHDWLTSKRQERQNVSHGETEGGHTLHLEGLECPNCLGTFLEAGADNSIHCVMCGTAFVLAPQREAVKVFDYTDWFIEHFGSPGAEDDRSYSNE